MASVNPFAKYADPVSEATPQAAAGNPFAKYAPAEETSVDTPPENKTASYAKGALALMSPALTVAQGIRSPVDHAVGMAKGVVKAVPDAVRRMGKDLSSAGSNLAEAYNNPGLWNTPKNVGKAALNIANVVFDPVNSLIENTYGQQASKATGGVVSPETASFLPELAAPTGVGALVAGGKKIANPALVGAFERIGVKNLPKDADAIQSAVKTGLGAAKQTVASSGGALPLRSAREMAMTTGEGIGNKQKGVMDLAKARWDNTRAVGEGIDASNVSNLDQVNDVIGRTKTELSGAGDKAIQDLRIQKLTDDSDILDIRERIHDLESQGHGLEVSPLTQSKRELIGRRLQAAKDQLAQKQKIADIRGKQLEQAEKTAVQPKKGGVPTQIKSATDLIDLKQHLNSVDTGRMSAQEFATHKNAVVEVDNALQEIAKANPAFGKSLTKANKTYEKVKVRYEGDAARSLGVDKALLAATKGTGKNIVGKDYVSNVLASTEGLDKKINQTFQVDWLKANMKPTQFRQLMATRLDGIMKDIQTDPNALRANRELIDHILNRGIEVKGPAAKQALDDMQKVFDELDSGKISLEMAPKEYRDAMGLAARSWNAVKSAASLISSSGKPTTYGISKGAEAFKGGDQAAEAKRLLALRNKLQPKRPMTRTLTGAAVGGVLAGSNADRGE